MSEFVDEPTLNPIKSTTQFQDQKNENVQSSKPKINQPYNPLNVEISDEDSNPWSSPSLLIYENSDQNLNKFSKSLNVNFFDANQRNETLLPLYIRPVSTILPNSSITRNLTHLPIGIIISPGLVDQQRLPITDLSKSSLIRCPRCSAHISPYCDVSTDGKHWKCGICGNDTIFLTGNVHVKEKDINNKQQIYSPLDKKPKDIKTVADLYSNGTDTNNSIISHEDRLEISSPVIDIITPRNYNLHEKAGPSFLFIFDLSYNSILHFYAQSAASSILSIMDQISDETYISLITIDTRITIYDLKKNNRTTYPDLDPEVLKDELSTRACMLKDESGNCRSRFILALKEIQSLQIDLNDKNSDNIYKDRGNCIGSAFEVVPYILNDIGGIVMAFIYGPCDVGPRSSSRRSPDEMINETLLLKMPKTESSSFYGFIARLYARSMISLHLFAASGKSGFVDLAVIGVPCGLTGGRCHILRGFDPTINFSELHREIYRTLTMHYFWDATLRLKTSGGISIHRIHANCQLTSPNSISIPAISMEDSFVYEFVIHNNVRSDTITFQFELEWNDEKRMRKIRVFNFSLPVSDDPLQILKHVDEAALSTILMKRTISMVLAEGAISAAKFFVEETKDFAKAISVKYKANDKDLIPKYKFNFVLFPNFKRFPKITFGLVKSPYLLDKFPNGPDGRFAQILQMRAIGIVDLILYVYPRLLTIENKILPLSKKSLNQYMESLNNNCILIVHSCNAIFIWAISKEVLINKLSNSCDDGVVSQSGAINIDKITDQKLKDLIRSCWNISRKYLLSFAIYGENVLDSLLIEDSITSNFNYASWICSLTKIV